MNVLYYHKGWGVIGAGIIKNSTIREDKANEELYRDVKLITPQIKDEKGIHSISASELRVLLGKNFYFASTIKSPYLSDKEAELVINELKNKYGIL
ncbi:hypothetical protein [Peptostreptococcus canis]|uniref:Uncharacterized protein n=1 Tax=Peptostreptococcus canis TaxID=1159213 RepID=A0ABR6TJE9_9FIRM|nr:hypothetical protein [Peptostreptococcus canis]MBC2575552.1 hypothetical protein [Peptostreptococcus canis]MBP1997252.1 hypothetical protein [Peptostreptococcus canis]